jgi:cell wall-associated NlpC family hydrolase
MYLNRWAARAAVLTVLFNLLSCVSTVRYSAATAPDAMTKNTYSYVTIPREKIMAVVNRYSGVPYHWGGEGRDGMDCSGFIRTVLWECERIELPHSSREMAQFGVAIPASNLESGDLLFFKINSFMVNHVGVYLGDGKFAHASLYSGVTVTDMNDDYYHGKFAYARRLYFN